MDLKKINTRDFTQNYLAVFQNQNPNALHTLQFINAWSKDYIPRIDKRNIYTAFLHKQENISSQPCLNLQQQLLFFRQRFYALLFAHMLINGRKLIQCRSIFTEGGIVVSASVYCTYICSSRGLAILLAFRQLRREGHLQPHYWIGMISKHHLRRQCSSSRYF